MAAFLRASASLFRTQEAYFSRTSPGGFRLAAAEQFFDVLLDVAGRDAPRLGRSQHRALARLRHGRPELPVEQVRVGFDRKPRAGHFFLAGPQQLAQCLELVTHAVQHLAHGVDPYFAALKTIERESGWPDPRRAAAAWPRPSSPMAFCATTVARPAVASTARSAAATPASAATLPGSRCCGGFFRARLRRIAPSSRSKPCRSASSSGWTAAEPPADAPPGYPPPGPGP